MSTGALDVKPLITHRYSINDAIDAYKCLDDRSSLGIILDYPNDNVNELSQRLVTISSDSISYKKSDAVCTFVGAGNYASRI
ncbi:dehydrogenase, partial [Vibrio parahaemolyticus]